MICLFVAFLAAVHGRHRHNVRHSRRVRRTRVWRQGLGAAIVTLLLYFANNTVIALRSLLR